VEMRSIRRRRRRLHTQIDHVIMYYEITSQSSTLTGSNHHLVAGMSRSLFSTTIEPTTHHTPYSPRRLDAPSATSHKSHITPYLHKATPSPLLAKRRPQYAFHGASRSRFRILGTVCTSIGDVITGPSFMPTTSIIHHASCQAP